MENRYQQPPFPSLKYTTWWRPWLYPGPCWGSSQRYPDSTAKFCVSGGGRKRRGYKERQEGCGGNGTQPSLAGNWRPCCTAKINWVTTNEQQSI